MGFRGIEDSVVRSRHRVFEHVAHIAMSQLFPTVITDRVFVERTEYALVSCQGRVHGRADAFEGLAIGCDADVALVKNAIHGIVFQSIPCESCQVCG